MSDKIIATKVASRFQKEARAIPRDGTVTRPLESALFANGNGGVTLSIIEQETPSRKAGGDPSFTYYLHHEVMHFSASNEARFELGNVAMVQWLAGALARAAPFVQRHETIWARDFIGNPEVHYRAGVNVEKPPAPMLTDSWSEDEG